MNRIGACWLLVTGLLVFQSRGIASGGTADTMRKKVTMVPETELVRIDGRLDEKVWNTLPPLTGFTNHWPVDSGAASLPNRILITCDQKYLYIAAVCSLSATPLIKTLKRDNAPWENDGIYVVLDPADLKLSGYLFGVNAGGAQTEGIVQGDNLITEWDARWYSAVQRTDSNYTVEMAIPFSSLRFRPENKTWGLNIVRSDMFHNCYSTWSQVPLQFYAYNLNYTGALQWQQPPMVKHAENIIQPYINAGAYQDHNSPPPSTTATLKMGADARISLNTHLNLDLTFHPDFSQVEVDRMVLNTDRFSPLLPEKRTFFLENSDLFSNFGVGNLRPFISRRIGLTDDGQVKTILGGARLTGNLNKDLKIGIMDVQVSPFAEKGPENDFVAVMEHKVFQKSSLKGIVTNVQEIGTSKGPNFNRLAGAEFNYFSNTNVHQFSVKYHHSLDTFGKDQQHFLLLYYGYFRSRISSLFYLTDMGDHFNPGIGFSPYNHYYDVTTGQHQYKGYKQLYNNTSLLFPFKSGSLYNIMLATTNYFNVYSHGGFMEAKDLNALVFNFSNTSQLSFTSDQHKSNVPFATQYVGEQVNAGNYWFSVYSLTYNSDKRRKISTTALASAGDYFGGTMRRFSSTLNFLRPPFLNAGAGIDYNRIRLNGKNIDLLFLTSSLDLSLSQHLFWTTLLQFNTQAQKFNINSRLQWHFRPMSDVYLLYTDYYQTATFQPQNRTLVLKINYWINL